MGIKQFNGEWVSQEDRVMFRFNTHENQEFSFWLTRRMVQALLQGTQQLSVHNLEKTHAPHVAQAVQAFQQQAVAQQVKFRDGYESAAEKPLGEQPLLVVGLGMNQDGEQTHIEFELVTGQRVNLNLPQTVLQLLVILLNKLQDNASWGVGLAAADASIAPTATTPPPQVH
jgi:hypothetical protein